MGMQTVVPGEDRRHKCQADITAGSPGEIRVCDVCGKFWRALRLPSNFSICYVQWYEMGPIETWWRVYRRKAKG